MGTDEHKTKGFGSKILLPVLASSLALDAIGVVRTGQQLSDKAWILHLGIFGVLGLLLYLPFIRLGTWSLRWNMQRAQTLALTGLLSTTPLNLLFREVSVPFVTLIMILGAMAILGLLGLGILNYVRFFREKIGTVILLVAPITLEAIAYTLLHWHRYGTFAFALTSVAIGAAFVMLACFFGGVAFEKSLGPQKMSIAMVILCLILAPYIGLRDQLSVDKRMAPPKKPAPSIFVLSGDSIRADHMPDIISEMGFIGKESVQFQRAYSPSSTTDRSLHDVLRGKVSTSTKPIGFSVVNPQAAETMVCRLRELGYITVLNLGWRSRNILPECFDLVFSGFPPPSRAGAAGIIEVFLMRLQLESPKFVPSQEQEEFLEKLLRDNQSVDRPIFYFEHNLIAHWPYVGNPAFEDQSCDGASASQVRQALDRHVRYLDKTEAEQAPESTPVVKCMYKREAWQWAQHIKQMGTLIRRTDKEAVIIVTSDHGEEFFEEGFVGHGKRLTEINVHVPLLVLSPRMKATTVKAPYSTSMVLPWVWNTVTSTSNCQDNSMCLDKFTRLPVASTLPKQATWRTHTAALSATKECKDIKCLKWFCVDRDTGAEKPCEPALLAPEERSSLMAEFVKTRVAN